MRTDATIDRRLVQLPHADTLGYGKWKAQTGDFVVFRTGGKPDGGFPQIGRVAGRVHRAPALEANEEAVHDWLLVITFSQDMTFVMERWVRPEWVIRCYSPTDKQAALWAFMLSPEFAKRTPDELREWSASGFSSWDAFEKREVEKP
jgi:hypothetical protein